jgi:hypothetical protein
MLQASLGLSVVATARRSASLRASGVALMSVVVLALALLPAAPGEAADCVDGDGDGYVVCGGCTVPVGKICGDCNDGDSAINPGAVERCDDAIDSDCDGNNENGYPNLGAKCAFCSGPDCGGSVCIGEVNCGGFTGALCLTGSNVVCGQDGTSETCALPLNPLAVYEAEGLGLNNVGNYTEATCSDGNDNDCDNLIDADDPSCQAPEICDGRDNDGDGAVDELFPLSNPGTVGNPCSAGVGSCQRSGILLCSGDGSDAVCGALPGAPKNEGALFGLSCDNGEDDDCDGLTDLFDPDCAGFGQPELCGDGIDNDGDTFIDEGFPQIGQPCATGVGACAAIGALVCNGSGTGVECNAAAGFPALESPGSGTCNDLVDNDCDGFTDAADTDCGAAFADLGVTCSLPYTNGKPGKDCTGKHTVTFGAEAEGVTLKADLLALGVDGSLLGIIEDVANGDEAHLASRIGPGNFRVDSKTNRHRTTHTVFAPMPVLRVTGTNGAVEDVAYCSIMPWLEVTAPDGQTISLNESSTLDVEGFLPLVDVDSVGLAIDGVDILAELGIDPVTQFPTNGGVLCPAPGDCVFQIEAGCGDGSLVDVEITNFRVEGLDRDIAYDAKAGVEQEVQVNTFAFTISGLPAGGHIFYVNGQPLPLPRQLSNQCLVDDLEDAGTASAFGIQVDSPSDQQVVASAPVWVEGTVCGGNEIASLRIQGNDVPVGGQICTSGNGTTSADECVLDFSEPIDATDLQAAVDGTAIGGTFNLGSNRVIADAVDDRGTRTFNTDVIFGLGQDFQAPGVTAQAQQESFYKAGRDLGRELGKQVAIAQKALGDEIDPAFVIGLDPAAVQDFFNEKCQGAIEQFTTQASANLTGKVFATVDFTPSCSCDLNDVPVVLESATFPANAVHPPGCVVDFQDNQIGVTIYLPDIRVQVGAHDSCTDHGLFGECIARTKINMTAVSQVTDVAFKFAITEDGIENKTPPDPDTQVITWLIEDNDGTELFYGGNCSAGTRAGEICISDSQCPGSSCDCARGGDGQCSKRGTDEGYNPVTVQNSSIECWGAEVCNAFATVGAVLIEVFTLGYADGFEIVGIIDFDVDFQEDFLAEVDGSEPDPLALDEVEIDADTVASFEQGTFSPGMIDVEIDPNGLKIEVPASFTSLTLDPMAEETPGAVLTPAAGPSISALVAASDEISIGLADDVFNQLFASMRQAGSLKAFCTAVDGLTVDSLLPDVGDGGCDSLGAGDGEVTGGDAIVQGMCHAIRGEDCLSLTGDTLLLTNNKKGACVGFSGGDCTTLNVGAKVICDAVPARDLHADDAVLLCARQDIEPLLLFHNDDATDNTVDTDLLLNDTNVVFAIDKAGDGYTGELEDLQGCFGEEGDASPDCLLYAVCLDLTLKTTMGIDNSTCAPTQTGFVFNVNQVIASGLQPGIMCSAATGADDQLVTGEGFDSVVIDTVSDAAESFTPPFCADGLTLGGVLSFAGPSAKMFAITTDGATPGFADFLFLTGALTSP